MRRSRRGVAPTTPRGPTGGAGVRYGFAIDQRTCIGCHACTVACKTEHEVPVGQFRTWVKYVDQGTFPNNTRDFGVMRCNHCTDAPVREDLPDPGAVQARGRHRRLRPRPLHRLQELHAGLPLRRDLHRRGHPHRGQVQLLRAPHRRGPRAGVRRRLPDALDLGRRPRRPGQRDRAAGQPTTRSTVRAPEQNTGPNVFYLGADRAVLDPLAAPVDDSYIYSTPDAHRAEVAADLPRSTRSPGHARR